MLLTISDLVIKCFTRALKRAAGSSFGRELPFTYNKKNCSKMVKAVLQNDQFVYCPDPSMSCPRLELYLFKGDFIKTIYL